MSTLNNKFCYLYALARAIYKNIAQSYGFVLKNNDLFGMSQNFLYLSPVFNEFINSIRHNERNAI